MPGASISRSRVFFFRKYVFHLAVLWCSVPFSSTVCILPRIFGRRFPSFILFTQCFSHFTHISMYGYTRFIGFSSRRRLFLSCFTLLFLLLDAFFFLSRRTTNCSLEHFQFPRKSSDVNNSILISNDTECGHNFCESTHYRKLLLSKCNMDFRLSIKFTYAKQKFGKEHEHTKAACTKLNFIFFG